MDTANNQQPQPSVLRHSISKKVAAIFIAIVLVLVGIRFGLIGGLIGAALAGVVLKQFGVVGAGSAWVTETKGVHIAKYILLAVVLVAILILAFYLLK